MARLYTDAPVGANPAAEQRPAVKRGRMVNRSFGDLSMQLHERHDASDFDTKTQDKLAPVSA